MNKLTKVITVLLLMTLIQFANAQQFEHIKPHKPTLKEQKQFDKMIDERLHLTDEQKAQIKSNRAKHLKNMQKTISKMEALHKKIKNVYMLGLPKYQAELRIAPYKTELALLKQEAKRQRAEYHKNFENILTKEQKTEFEKMKKEHIQKRPYWQMEKPDIN